MKRQIGVVDLVWGREAPLPRSAARAKELGFEHIDVPWDWVGELAIPVGRRKRYDKPQAGCSFPAPAAIDGDSWDHAVSLYRSEPTALMEPWGGSVCNSVETVEAMMEAVPGLRIVLDTGHVANWGGDPVEFAQYADHVQLRQASKSVPQAWEGDVDFPKLLKRLDEVEYNGLLSVEYFDSPTKGFAFDNPEGAAVALLREIQSLST